MGALSRRELLHLLGVQALTSRAAFAQGAGRAAEWIAAPRPLAADAVTHDWPSFLGPTHDAVSTETRLTRELPPPLVWQLDKGSGYSSLAVVEGRLVFLHRLGNEEVIECRHPETGARQWEFRYPTRYEDRYGYNDGPRSSPVIDGPRAYAIGAEDKLHCLDLDTGKLLWMRDLRTEYGVPQDFFGTATSPLVDGEVLVINVGAPGGPCVVGLERTTGAEVWRAGTAWGPSYASPVPAVVHGQPRVFVFAGGESKPPAGGLMSIDPRSGAVDFEFPWRSRAYESANASCPVVFDNKVFISASYRTGGALVEVRPDFTPNVLWTAPEFALHFNTPIHRDGYLYGFDGRNEGDASLACVDAATGEVVWREIPEWTETIGTGAQAQERLASTYRGSLLSVDGQFLCLGELGHLLWLDLSPSGYRQISRAWLFAAPESWTLPVLSRGLLYVMQNRRDLLGGPGPQLRCYDLRA